MEKLIYAFFLLLALVCLSEGQIYQRGQAVVAGEYFLNRDPGPGKATPIVAQYGSTEVAVDLDLRISKGTTVYIRFRSSDGLWGPARSIRFTYKQIRSAQCYVKYLGGDSSEVLTMGFEPRSDSSALYHAVSELAASDINGRHLDRIVVRFETEDFLWSDWTSFLPVSVTKIKAGVPAKFELAQNYPNPFNPSTTIQFALPKSAYVTLRVYDLLGRQVAELVSEKLNRGTYKTRWDARELASGVYLCRLQADDFAETEKLLLLR
jgi:hypothetical protein